MNYKEFISKVKSLVENEMSDEYSVQLHIVVKNNDIEKDGLTILKKGERVSPTIYLNEYFERYTKGEAMESIIQEIINLRITTVQNEALNSLTENMLFTEWEDRIVFRVVNYTRNRKRLTNLPFIKFLDLAITFHCLVKCNEEGIGSFAVTRELMEQWNVTAKELLKVSSENTKRIFPPSIRTMEEVLSDMLPVEMRDELDNQELLQSMSAENFEVSKYSMYILSNSNGINGASAMLYRDVIDNFSQKIDSSFYILPSSIHEVILVPTDGEISKDNLMEMVTEVNRTQVSDEEVLSNSVYFYDKVQRSIGM
ncbi:MAG TPA: DUF5688 family protein [Lachnospiraceae bacterium]|nr:DUF5688 family protein [Lachnospiraceae bacterium]